MVYIVHIHFIPPTPGPIAAISNFNLLDNIGMVMILGVIVAIPSSIISYLFAKKIMIKSRLINIKTLKKINKPHILAYMSIIIPLVLISLNTLTNLINKNEFLLLSKYILNYWKSNFSFTFRVNIFLSYSKRK